MASLAHWSDSHLHCMGRHEAKAHVPQTTKPLRSLQLTVSMFSCWCELRLISNIIFVPFASQPQSSCPHSISFENESPGRMEKHNEDVEMFPLSPTQQSEGSSQMFLWVNSSLLALDLKCVRPRSRVCHLKTIHYKKIGERQVAPVSWTRS